MKDNFNKRRNLLSFIKRKREKNVLEEHKKDDYIDDHLFYKCPNCKNSIIKENLNESNWICSSCGFYLPLNSKKRLDLVMDTGYIEIQDKVEYKNPLNFPEYEKKLEGNAKKSNQNEAIRVALGKIEGSSCIVVVLDSSFLMGSMGTYVGEQVTKAFEKGIDKKLPVIIFSASGGARMQEGILSLMQMAKTSNAVREHSEKGLLYISCLTNPTTGGVTASFASLGDIIIAEPKALIGFAGPRVIKQTIKQDLPEGFQSSEFLMEHGFIDTIVERDKLREVLSKILKIHGIED
ncbi:acetyl-CoA carboxylase, carboxyltransferase subunit beta [Miniphocaeibacter massiliensis]|uniref:acetyl-CoA carboxylase, carboxyltransferase subunit beta n=1 Tax=Miniphocaeibacter massiliensis TaxID=2041841 RepID=UPI000C1C3275|nr:acetyl-CoA carboxylase, carboxyltransferase subunit beta [Miniphocaeibacter massiliensis]